ncbi:hypothetical protein ACO0K9_14100 [Undibacterium sp. Ji50W]
MPELQVSSQNQAIDTKTIVVDRSKEELRTLQLSMQAKAPADSK